MKKYNGFSFKSKSIRYTSIEEAICDYYGLGSANSSSFFELKPNMGGQSITIYAENGRISCRVSAFQEKDSDLFVISVDNVEITQKR